MFKRLLVLVLIGVVVVNAILRDDELIDQLETYLDELNTSEFIDIIYGSAKGYTDKFEGFERIASALELLHKVARDPVCSYEVEINLKRAGHHLYSEMIAKGGELAKLVRGFLDVHLTVCTKDIDKKFGYAFKQQLKQQNNPDTAEIFTFIGEELEECKSYKETKHDDLWGFDCLSSQKVDTLKLRALAKKWVETKGISTERMQEPCDRFSEEFTKDSNSMDEYYRSSFFIPSWIDYVSSLIGHVPESISRLRMYRQIVPVYKHCELMKAVQRSQ